MRSDQIGSRIKALRESHGMTQLQLAAKAGVDTTMLSRVERGEVIPSIPWLEKVAAGLGVGFLVELVDPQAAVGLPPPKPPVHPDSGKVRRADLLAAPEIPKPKRKH